ncbi:MAG: hypothetical protein AAF191_08955 [Verrucomicrobiota bacterium]
MNTEGISLEYDPRVMESSVNPLSGFVFRSPADQRQAELAIMGEPLSPLVEEPIIIITGPIQSGKTRLARIIASARGDKEGTVAFWPENEEARELLLASIFTDRPPVMIFDDSLSPKRVLRSRLLSIALTAGRIALQVHGDVLASLISSGTQFIFTGEPDPLIDAELSRRARIIRLGDAEPNAEAQPQSLRQGLLAIGARHVRGMIRRRLRRPLLPFAA